MEANVQTIVTSPGGELDIAPETEPITEDDRSSSLSELEDGSESANAQLLPLTVEENDEDTEAETERLDNSPEKFGQQRRPVTSPSKLAQNAVSQMSPDIEKFSDSAISSPISSEVDGISDDPGDEHPVPGKGMSLLNDDTLLQSSKKRKRSLLDDEIHVVDDDEPTTRRKRARSSASNDEDNTEVSDVDEGEMKGTREPSIDGAEHDHDDEDISEMLEADEEQPDKAILRKTVLSPRRAVRRKTSPEAVQGDPINAASEHEEAEESEEEEDEVEAAEGDEGVDEAEAAAKSEEELAKRMAAMEELVAIEKRFATLRDRLYDEKIAEINHELAQLADPEPRHPELLRQIEVVQKYRDDKFAHEQKLLVYKIGALKRKSVAERSQIHSAFFQKIRDTREDYLERVSEHFYRIQRDRFKTETRIPDFSIPFPDRRSVQISQQMSYNKEVSILSGVAKYVGFPAAPHLSNARNKELEDDLEKMGISAAPPRTSKQSQRPPAALTYGSSISRPAAEEQFLEQTPWANPQHPAHRLHIHRQTSNRSPASEQVTPAHKQQGIGNGPAGSASTIVENPSQAASSIANTPHDDQSNPRNGVASHPIYRHPSSSPFESRKANTTTLGTNNAKKSTIDQTPGSSPLAPRAFPAKSPPRTSEVPSEKIPRHDPGSPSLMNRFGRDVGITTSPALNRFKV